MIAYEQLVQLRESVEMEIIKKKRTLRISCTYDWDYKRYNYFTMNIGRKTDDGFSYTVFFTYQEKGEEFFHLNFTGFREEGPYRITSEKDIIKNIEEIYDVCKVVENEINKWVKKQPQLRLECLFKNVLRKRVLIKEIENHWRMKNDSV